MKRRCPYRPKHTYTALDLLMASPQPMPDAQRTAYMAGFATALHTIQYGSVSTPENWRVMADAVNLVETFCSHPWPDPAAPGELIDIADESGALAAANQAMTQAARLHKLQGGNIRLSADGRQALADLVDLLGVILQTVSHRSALQCHNQTEAAILKQRKFKSTTVVQL